MFKLPISLFGVSGRCQANPEWKNVSGSSESNMKIKGKFLQIWILSLAMFPGAVAQAQYTFVTNANDTITITGYSDVGSYLSIPDTLDGLPVTGITNLTFADAGLVESIAIPASVTNIAPGAFAGVGALLSVDTSNSAYSSVDGVLFDKGQTALLRCPGQIYGNYDIPDTVTNIADYAFYYCENLTNITIPNGVVRIGNFVFYACYGLTNITVPASVTVIGTNSFVTGNIKSITVDGLNPCFSSLGGVLFNKDQTLLIQMPMGETGSYTIPDTVTMVGDYSFYSSALTNIIVPANVTTLGTGVFNSVWGINSIAIPNSIGSIGDADFFSCQNLTNVSLPDTITNIGDQAFSGCPNLPAISLPAGLVNIGDKAFLFCEDLTNITIPDGVTNIGAYAFSECFALTNFNIPGGVHRIREGTFSFCENLSSIIIPTNITSIGDSAFYYSGLTNIIIPNSVTCIGNSAFSFSDLVHAVVGDGVTCIGSNAFENCSRLETVTLGDGLTNLGQMAFYACVDLTSIVVPNGVTNIEDSTFNDCFSLTNVILGTGASSIGDYAFYNCDSLTGLYFAGNAPVSVSSDIFDVNQIGTVYYPPNRTGWGATFDGRPTAPWFPQITEAGFSASANQFGFTINWASGQSVVVDVCTNLNNPDWEPVQTNMLMTGSLSFADPDWLSYPSRYYRLRSP